MAVVFAFCFLGLIFTVAANSYFGITYLTYDRYALKGAIEVKKIRMLPAPTATNAKAIMQRHSMTCNRMCALNTKCASSLAMETTNGDVYCHLYSSNLCINPKLELEPIPLSISRTYDKVQAGSTSQACNENCMLENPGNCTLCLRPGCTGARCEICSRTCSDCYKITHPNSTFEVEVECILWLGFGNMYKKFVRCLGDKVLLFHRFSFPNGTSRGSDSFALSNCFDLISSTQKFLYIELYTENDTSPSYTVTYSGLDCFPTNKSISLQTWVNGSATDGLGVPILATDVFVEDTWMYHPSCGPFWSRQASNFANPVNETAFGFGPCPGLATAFFGTPNVTNGVFTSGIAWATLPNIQLIGVKIYMF